MSALHNPETQNQLWVLLYPVDPVTDLLPVEKRRYRKDKKKGIRERSQRIDRLPVHQTHYFYIFSFFFLNHLLWFTFTKLLGFLSVLLNHL